MTATLDKQQVYSHILQALEALVDNARQATLRAYETATHEENIAENKYDTLGLEAAYLTQGQARRLAQCEADLVAFRNLPWREFAPDETIGMGALVALEDDAGVVQWFLVGPAAGGVKIQLAGQSVVVITAEAPLGQTLLKNCHAGDEITLALAGKQKRYDVVSVA